MYDDCSSCGCTLLNQFYMISGKAFKMNVQRGEQVDYTLNLHEEFTQKVNSISMNNFLGKPIQLRFDGVIKCVSCDKQIRKSFQQGFCWDCFNSAPEAAVCIMKPELCTAHIDGGVESKCKNHNRDQIVYLTSSDVIKVGVTGDSIQNYQDGEVLPRWIDQGATAGIVLAVCPNRYEAGRLEVALKSAFADKMNWRKMLKNEIDENIDLEEKKWELEETLPSDLTQYFSDHEKAAYINYPVLDFPTKLKSLSFDKEAIIEGVLKGIKGQYLLLDNNRVLNIRKHTGYILGFEG